MNKHIARLFALLLIISISSQAGLSEFDNRTFGVKEGEIYEYELTRLRKNGEVVNSGIFLNTNWDDSYINEGESVKITIDKLTISDSFFSFYDRINVTIDYKGQTAQDVVGGGVLYSLFNGWFGISTTPELNTGILVFMGIYRLFNHIEPDNPTFISDNIATVKSKINYTVTPIFDIIEEKNTVGFHIVYYNGSTIKERNIELNTEKMIITYLEIDYGNDSSEEYDQIIISSKTIPPVIFEPSLVGEGSAQPNTTNFPIFIFPVALFVLYFGKKYIPK